MVQLDEGTVSRQGEANVSLCWARKGQLWLRELEVCRWSATGTGTAPEWKLHACFQPTVQMSLRPCKLLLPLVGSAPSALKQSVGHVIYHHKQAGRGRACRPSAQGHAKGVQLACNQSKQSPPVHPESSKQSHQLFA